MTVFMFSCDFLHYCKWSHTLYSTYVEHESSNTFSLNKRKTRGGKKKQKRREFYLLYLRDTRVGFVAPLGITKSNGYALGSSFQPHRSRKILIIIAFQTFNGLALKVMIFSS